MADGLFDNVSLAFFCNVSIFAFVDLGQRMAALPMGGFLFSSFFLIHKNTVDKTPRLPRVHFIAADNSSSLAAVTPCLLWSRNKNEGDKD